MANTNLQTGVITNLPSIKAGYAIGFYGQEVQAAIDAAKNALVGANEGKNIVDGSTKSTEANDTYSNLSLVIDKEYIEGEGDSALYQNRFLWAKISDKYLDEAVVTSLDIVRHYFQGQADKGEASANIDKDSVLHAFVAPTDPTDPASPSKVEIRWDLLAESALNDVTRTTVETARAILETPVNEDNKEDNKDKALIINSEGRLEYAKLDQKQFAEELYFDLIDCGNAVEQITEKY